MIHKTKEIPYFIVLFLFVIGCSSSSQNQNAEMVEAVEEVEQDFGMAESGDSAGGEDFSFEEADESAEFEEFGGDEFGGDEFDEGSFSEEDFSEESFAEEDFSEDAFADQGTTDEGFQEFPAEESMTAEESMAMEEEFEEPAQDPFMDEAMTDGESGPVIEDISGESDLVTIENIEFRANESGGTVVVETSRAADYKTRVNPDTNQFIVEVANARLPEDLKRPFIMKEFEGAFAAINAYQNPGSTTVRIVVQQKTAVQPIVQQEGSSLLVIPGEPSTAVAETDSQMEPESSEQEAPDQAGTNAEGEEGADGLGQAYAKSFADDERILGARTLDEFLMGNNKFFGKPISIEFSKDADVRDVINFIAEQSGVNIVMSDEVEGTISIKLREVPWDQALVIIMRSKKLGYTRQGNVIRISSLDQLQAESQSARQIIQAQKQLSPLKVKVIPVSFAKVEDIKKQIEPFLSKDRGKAVSDKRTSSLIVTDTDERIEKVSRLVNNLDIPPAQVMIEGKIVEASEEYSREVGINWGFDGQPTEISESGGVGGSPIDLTPSLSIRPTPGESIAGSQSLFNVEVGVLDVLGDLDAALSLAEEDNLVRVISSPRVIAINKEQAEITQSGEVINVSVVVQDGSTTRTPNRIPVELKLTVTPQITADGSVIMDVEFKRQFPGAVAEETTQARPINTREAKTKVLVDNGQTAVIGGIYSNDETTVERGTPWLRHIPILGWLFKSKAEERRKNELLIFLTPRILNLQEQKGKDAA